jgi:hypothetical protein
LGGELELPDPGEVGYEGLPDSELLEEGSAEGLKLGGGPEAALFAGSSDDGGLLEGGLPSLGKPGGGLLDPDALGDIGAEAPAQRIPGLIK